VSTSTTKPTVQTGFETRVLVEGYGPGAWHGPDLKAAIADVTPTVAFWRPAAGRHNIAEIALHHAYCTRAVWSQISGRPAEAFVLEGEDWFDVSDETSLSWRKILTTLDAEQQRLGALVADIETGKATSALADPERFTLVLGITSHAIYHAGQIQLIKRLRER
jgi:DinB superfamily